MTIREAGMVSKKEEMRKRKKRTLLSVDEEFTVSFRVEVTLEVGRRGRTRRLGSASLGVAVPEAPLIAGNEVGRTDDGVWERRKISFVEKKELRGW
jgi:pyruvate/2-oxoglutarate dehydrogenase complex dihydrolipoamide dehydrogenase (E3) component